MPISRRTFLGTTAALLPLPYISRSAIAAMQGQELPVPALVETSSDETELVAGAGKSSFFEGASTRTWGFNQPYLGPTLRFTRGQIARMRVKNNLRFPITCHWHGLHVPAIVDGGPQLAIDPDSDWPVDLPIDQPASTLWYHSHAHGVTAEHVYGGLAGLILVEDPDAETGDLPNTYGVDDLPLIIQDRAFNPDGSLYYIKRGPALMHGFRADTILVNGAIQPTANVPSGIVRLRILNGSNARIYHLRFSDGRRFHQIASDGGLLPKPIARTSITLAPAERAELLADFSDAASVSLLSGPDFNSPMGMMGGMMGGRMGGMLPGPPPQSDLGEEGEFEILRFEPDKQKAATISAIPDRFASAPDPDFGDPVRTRQFRLNMHAGGMGGGMMGRMRRGQGPMDIMGINEKPYDPNRIDAELKKGETELWEITADEMAHPFHVHGTAFQVLSVSGQEVPFDDIGLKDVLLVEDRAEILVRINHQGDAKIPYMFHCHILEHEDAGMMGQFTVT